MHVRCRLFQVLSLLTLKFAPAVVACTLPQSQFIIRHLPGTPARFTKRFATRESSGPSLAARTALQPWGYFCFFVQWVCSRALSLCSGLASLLLRPQWPPLLSCNLPLLFVSHSIAGWPWYYSPAVRPWRRSDALGCCPLLDSRYRLNSGPAHVLVLAAGCSRSSTVFTGVCSGSSVGHRSELACLRALASRTSVC